MTENPLPISNLNDFIFCPVSIYFHSLDSETERLSYQQEYQINGTAAHEAVDLGRYSKRRTVLQAFPVYCDRYGLYGKIDLLDTDKGILTERKKKISNIYDGYVFQLYAQYFALREAGYTVNEMRLYSMDDNRTYKTALPEEDEEMFGKFEALINEIQTFKFDEFLQNNPLKCQKCIYEPLCSFSCKL